MATNTLGLLFLGALGALGLACGGKSSKPGDGVSSGGSAGAAQSDAGSAPGGSSAGGANCSVGLEDLVDVSVTPRADTNLELMALKFSKRFVADQAIYDRFVRDMTAIRVVAPSLADIGYFAPNDGRALFLSVELDALARMKGGEYHAWDCLNRELVVTSLEIPEAALIPYVVVTLKGIYDLKTIGAQYAALEGVKSAQPNIGDGDGSTICVTIEGSNWHYLLDRASGDCTAGCTEHSFVHFMTDADGTVNALGVPNGVDRAAYANAEACR